MGFDVKRIFRIASDKHGRKDLLQNQQLSTDSASEDDVYSSPPSIRSGASYHKPPSVPLWKATSKDMRDNQIHEEPHPARGIRKKASRIARVKDSGGYFNGLAGGSGNGGNSNVEPKLDKMFDELRNPSEDAKDSLGVESTMNYLTSLGLNPESGEIFVALELVQAPNFGEITRQGFIDGWKTTTANQTREDQAAFVAGLVRQFSTDAAYFKRVYRYTFGAGKEPDQRSMSLDNAIEFWRVLFASPGQPWKTASHDWTELWTEFLREKWTRSVNRDMWNQTLEFAIKTKDDETLGFWNEDGAWPSVIDDFVAWCRDQRGIGAKKDPMEIN